MFFSFVKKIKNCVRVMLEFMINEKEN